MGAKLTKRGRLMRMERSLKLVKFEINVKTDCWKKLKSEGWIRRATRVIVRDRG